MKQLIKVLAINVRRADPNMPDADSHADHIRAHVQCSFDDGTLRELMRDWTMHVDRQMRSALYERFREAANGGTN